MSAVIHYGLVESDRQLIVRALAVRRFEALRIRHRRLPDFGPDHGIGKPIPRFIMGGNRRWENFSLSSPPEKTRRDCSPVPARNPVRVGRVK